MWCFGLVLSPISAHAVDLAQAYKRALSEDPTYQAAAADTEARREAIPQARAQLLPNINGSLMRSKNQTDQRTISAATPTDREYEYFSSNYAISLKQPIYRKYNFAQYSRRNPMLPTQRPISIVVCRIWLYGQPVFTLKL